MKTKDSNCSIAGLIGYRIPEEEFLNEYVERRENLLKFLSNEKLDSALRAFATNCELVVSLEINKLSPQLLNSTGPEVEQNPSVIPESTEP
jgi:hypothetical protein